MTVLERVQLKATESWFAWYPVKLQIGGWVWLRTVRRHRRNYTGHVYHYNGLEWLYDLPEQCLQDKVPNRSFKIRGLPIDDKAAYSLGISGIRLDDVCERVTPTRRITGIVVMSPQRPAKLSYGDETTTC